MNLVVYLLYSVLVTFIDTFIVWFLVKYSIVSLVVANTIGVVTGFVIHYLLSLKSVFKTEYGVKSFSIYFITFLFGLVLANLLIYMSYEHLFLAMGEDLRILCSKGVSIAIPFFVLYYIRKYLFLKIK